uniref:Small ribosomal subunit protein uS19 n=4 Tax=Candidatus Phytoplasma TaxID=33926 RepID=A0A286P908_9MOLU|nr:ribosomal protein S19 [Banana wilt phytoplasma]BBA46833.1 ribosomal protein S19 [Candidatus Phytoplasma noviguineense]BBA46842.1 ribosomal protein S19 ['Musa sp.' banana wilt phytoplasma]BBA46836.1 ribosomal protein S19 [Candidatus Phytoplasma noviguineense]BBA46845.1 ribosomal protein S19 ['Musa sp.' banana wilt phytoplasma]
MARSIKKGPFCDEHLLKKIIKQNENKTKNKKVIQTRSRRSIILPEFVGHKISVYNGKEYIISSVTQDMVGHKLGEFSPTRTFRGHAKKEDKKNTKK